MLAIALIAVLLALAVLHLYWGFGGYWPGHDAASLREMVVGARGARMYGLGPSAMVAGALTAAAAVVVVRHSAVMTSGFGWVFTAGYIVLILVFGLRGLAPYLTSIFDYSRGTAFFDLNRHIYAPLCLALAVGLVFDYPGGLGNVLRKL